MFVVYQKSTWKRVVIFLGASRLHLLQCVKSVREVLAYFRLLAPPTTNIQNITLGELYSQCQYTYLPRCHRPKCARGGLVSPRPQTRPPTGAPAPALVLLTVLQSVLVFLAFVPLAASGVGGCFRLQLLKVLGFVF